MLCDRQFQYTLVLRYICVKTRNVHPKQEMFGFSHLSFQWKVWFLWFWYWLFINWTNYVKHRTWRFYRIIKRKPNIHVLMLGSGSCNFQPCFRGGLVIFVPKGGGRPCVFFYRPHFQMPPPPPLYFLSSPLHTCIAMHVYKISLISLLSSNIDYLINKAVIERGFYYYLGNILSIFRESSSFRRILWSIISKPLVKSA